MPCMWRAAPICGEGGGDGDNDRPVYRERLEYGKRHVPGPRRHIYEEIVQLSPDVEGRSYMWRRRRRWSAPFAIRRS